MSDALAGEVLEQDDAGRWRTVRLAGVRVTDRRRQNPLGLSEEQLLEQESQRLYGFPGGWWPTGIVNRPFISGTGMA